MSIDKRCDVFRGKKVISIYVLWCAIFDIIFLGRCFPQQDEKVVIDAIYAHVIVLNVETVT